MYSMPLVNHLFAFALSSASLAAAQTRSGTAPASGDLVVCQPPQQCSYNSISKAVEALGSSDGSIFVYPGVYREQVVINKKGTTLIQGYTTDRTDYTKNQVTITDNLSAAVSGSNDLSGTVRAESAGISLYNLNIENTFGHTASGCQCQAIALSAQGDQGGFYGVNITSYQDTLLANKGAQIYASSRIAGAVDFIFGENAPAYFYKNSIESTAAGCITAPGGSTATSTQVYVFDQCNVIPAANAASNTTGKTFLGRPWKEFGKSVFRNSVLGAHINSAGWSEWSAATPNTADSVLGEYENSGAGSSLTDRASFTKKLTSSQAASYTAEILGSNFADWVDPKYYP